MILVVSETDSFLATSLVGKLETEGYKALLSHGSIKEIEQIHDGIELVILFMSAQMEDDSEKLVYIKDVAADLDRKIILIGDESEKGKALSIIPETLVLEW
ncbi:MAG: hypothetical protein IJI51_03530, partial [Lachnospiraceae bacterium]|nr:hypothetical protein [Lachnospiraceae bacterium]